MNPVIIGNAIWHKKGADKSDFADCELAWTNIGGAFVLQDKSGAIVSALTKTEAAQREVIDFTSILAALKSGASLNRELAEITKIKPSALSKRLQQLKWLRKVESPRHGVWMLR